MSPYNALVRVRLLIVALTLCILVQAGHGQLASRPNVLLILVDDMGWSDLGAYGGEIDTPHLDRLARLGLRFTQFHTTAKCFPSRSALLTGKYPEQVGMDQSPLGQIRDSSTIAMELRALGYRTFMVGKHHGSDNPVNLGFDRYVGLRDGASNHFNPGTHARAGEPEPARKVFMAPEGRWWCFDLECIQGYMPERTDFYTTDAYTDWALEFLRDAPEHASPFFLYLSYQAPHDPLQAWRDDIERYLARYAQGYAGIADARYSRMRDSGLIDARFPRSAPNYRNWHQLSEAERSSEARRMAVYAAMIDRIDQNVGRILEHLEQWEEIDQTLILFTSDNGASAEQVLDETGRQEIGAQYEIGSVGRWASLGPDWANVSNTPFRYYKNYSFEGGMAAPLILHWTNGIVDPGRVVSANTHLIDIFPTLLSVAQTSDPNSGTPNPNSNPTSGTPNPDPDPDSERTARIETSRTPNGRSLGLEGMDLSTYMRSSEALVRGQPVFQRWHLGRSARTERWKLVSQAVADETDWREILRQLQSQSISPDQLRMLAQAQAQGGDWQLYDMTRDITETTDVAQLHPQVVTTLASAYDRWLERVKTE